jgi:hypothetical protein
MIARRPVLFQNAKHARQTPCWRGLAEAMNAMFSDLEPILMANIIEDVGRDLNLKRMSGDMLRKRNQKIVLDIHA